MKFAWLNLIKIFRYIQAQNLFTSHIIIVTFLLEVFYLFPVLTAIAYAIREVILLVSYITNNSFPKPLSKEEEEKYLQALSKGDERAKEVLIEKNLRLVAHVTKKFENSAEDTEDLISIGTIGLIKAIDTFNNSRGTRLATYAARCIENEILMYLRSIKKNQKASYLYDPIGNDSEGNEITLFDVLGSDTDEVIDKVSFSLNKDKIYNIIDKLSEREQMILKWRYGLLAQEKKTQKEVADELGISRSYVSRIEKSVIKKISKEFLASKDFSSTARSLN